MLVDDEPDLLSVTKRGLEQRGYAVDAFSDPQEAVDSYKAGTYERIVTDIRMPRLNGFNLAREIRRRDMDSKFCFMTSFEIHAAEARSTMPTLPGYCFVQKPVTPSQLADHLGRHAAGTNSDK